MIEEYTLNDFNIRVLQQQKAGMDCCGDSFFIKETDDFMICGIADGLGSGKFAKEASKAAVQMAIENKNESLETIMSHVNASQQNLRGIVMSILKIDLKSRHGSFCGVGNIDIIINNNKTLFTHPLPTKGYISGKPLKFKIHDFVLPEEGWFSLFSDGIRVQPKWLPQLYCTLDPDDEKEAMAQMNNFSVRNLNDDVTIIIGKINKQPKN